MRPKSPSTVAGCLSFSCFALFPLLSLLILPLFLILSNGVSFSPLLFRWTRVSEWGKQPLARAGLVGGRWLLSSPLLRLQCPGFVRLSPVPSCP